MAEFEWARFTRAFASVRAKSTLLATLVVLVALGVGSFVLLELYERELVDNLDTTLEQQVADRVRLIETNGSNEVLTTVLQQEAFVWIGTPSGEVASQGGGIFPIDNPVPAAIGTTTTRTLSVEERKSDEVETERMELRLASALASTGDVVIAGAELEVIERSVGELARLFAIAVPLLAVLVGGLGWVVAGRALQPVDAIREQAEEISGATLAERVPVPDTHDEVQDLAVTMNEMLERIEHHDLAIRQFSSDASHELKSPIANITALIQTRTSSDPSWARLQAQLTSETSRLASLVENLLFLATHQDTNQDVERHAVQLDELLFSEAELVSETSDLRVGIGRVEPVAVTGSIGDLSRMVRNLVDNAVRHATSRIGLSLTTTDDRVTLVVEDDGPGIPVDDRRRVFERFTRLDEARARNDGGTGLGLSIVAQVAAAHGGTVVVADSELGGAAFEVTFSSRSN